MKKTIIASLMTVGLMASASVMANQGTVRFLGALTDQTCDVSVNGSTGNSHIVNLPQVSVKALDGNNTLAAPTTLSFVLQNCSLDPTKPKTARVFFTSNSNLIDYSNNTLVNNAQAGVGTTVAQNVGIKILYENGNEVLLGKQEQLDPSQPNATITAGSAELRYVANYARIGANAPTPGLVDASVNFVIDYQ